MDVDSRAQKISSARKLLKHFQQKKTHQQQILKPVEFTELLEANVTQADDVSHVPSQPHPEQAAPQPAILSVPLAPGIVSMDGSALPMMARTSQPVTLPALPHTALAQPPSGPTTPSTLPMYTFPSDGSASFSEYLGGSSFNPSVTTTEHTQMSMPAHPFIIPHQQITGDNNANQEPVVADVTVTPGAEVGPAQLSAAVMLTSRQLQLSEHCSAPASDADGSAPTVPYQDVDKPIMVCSATTPAVVSDTVEPISVADSPVLPPSVHSGGGSVVTGESPHAPPPSQPVSNSAATAGGPGGPLGHATPTEMHEVESVSAITGSDPTTAGDPGSMTSSFTFASQAGTGSSSHSATSSRTSDWEYVGVQEAAKPQTSGREGEDAAPAHLTSETLRQLSHRLSQMTADVTESAPQAVTSSQHALEVRNAQLASSLEAERSLRSVAEQQTESLRARVGELEASLETTVRGADQRLHERQAALAEQSRAQAQTIGILVAEKTELKAETERLSLLLAEKTDEVGKLNARLSASEANVSQLRDQLTQAGQAEVSVQHLQELYAQADNERNRNRELCQQLQEELDEVRARLRQQLEANSQLTQQLGDACSRLELAEIRVTQLSGPGAQTTEQASADAVRAAEAARAQAERAAEQARAERDAAAVQFQQYSASLSARLAEAEQQRDALSEQLSVTSSALSAAQQQQLQTRLQQESMQRQPPPPPPPAPAGGAPPVTDAEREELVALRQHRLRAEEEGSALRQQLQALIEEKDRLSTANQQLGASLRDMEVTVERANSANVNRDQLAREMESDRVAVSRAMAQNKQLKQQLEELQDGFITLSNKKLELTESLETEKQKCAQQDARLTQLQSELEAAVTQTLDAEQRHMSAQQLVDQLRHYEAVGRQAEALQRELTAAQAQLARQSAAADSQSHVSKAAPSAATSILEDQIISSSGPDDQIISSTSGPEDHIAPLEEALTAPPSESGAPSTESRASSPAGRPRPPIEEVIKEREELRARLQQFIGGGAVEPAEHERLRSALAQLEVRFCAAMSEVAELRDQRQALEHLCERLQGETDTIGEYISLYQVQRSALKAQAAENQQELATLQQDRQQLRDQLHQLQQLVAQLMADRPDTPLHVHSETVRAESAASDSSAAAAPGDTTTGRDAEDAAADADAEQGAETPPAGAEHAAGAVETDGTREVTARRIISLIEQIGANEFVDGRVAPLHVCQHCRGKRVLNV